MTIVRTVWLRSFEPLIAKLSPKAYRAWGRSIEWALVLGTDGFLSADDIKAIGPTPATLQELLQSGVWKVDEDGRTFVAELREGPVVAEVEGCEVEHRLPMTPAERARRYRASKRNGASRDIVTERHAGVTEKSDERHEVGVTESPNPPLIRSDSGSSPDPESSLTLSSPSDLTGSARVQRNRRRTALPADWKPTPEHIERASKTGLNLDRESMRFRSHHEAKGSLMANWNAAFTTWLLNAVEFARPPGAIQHEKTRQEERQRPELAFFEDKPVEGVLAPGDTLALLQPLLSRRPA